LPALHKKKKRLVPAPGGLGSDLRGKKKKKKEGFPSDLRKKGKNFPQCGPPHGRKKKKPEKKNLFFSRPPKKKRPKGKSNQKKKRKKKDVKVRGGKRKRDVAIQTRRRSAPSSSIAQKTNKIGKKGPSSSNIFYARSGRKREGGKREKRDIFIEKGKIGTNSILLLDRGGKKKKGREGAESQKGRRETCETLSSFLPPK